MCSAQFVSEPKGLCGQTCIFLLYTVTKYFPEPIQHYINRALILRGKGTWYGAGHSLISSAELKDGLSSACSLSICLHEVIFNSAEESFYIIYYIESSKFIVISREISLPSGCCLVFGKFRLRDCTL